MKKRMLPLSLVIGATLAIPSLAMAAPADTAPMDMQTAPAEAAATMNNNETSAEQSNPFVINETQTISRASMNSVNNNAAATQGAMPTELQAQQPEENMQNPQDIEAARDLQAQAAQAQAQAQAQAAMMQEGSMSQEEVMPEDSMLQEDPMLEEDMAD